MGPSPRSSQDFTWIFEGSGEDDREEGRGGGEETGVGVGVGSIILRDGTLQGRSEGGVLFLVVLRGVMVVN